jgi:hypothetical protein
MSRRVFHASGVEPKDGFIAFIRRIIDVRVEEGKQQGAARGFRQLGHSDPVIH